MTSLLERPDMTFPNFVIPERRHLRRRLIDLHSRNINRWRSIAFVFMAACFVTVLISFSWLPHAYLPGIRNRSSSGPANYSWQGFHRTGFSPGAENF